MVTLRGKDIRRAVTFDDYTIIELKDGRVIKVKA